MKRMIQYSALAIVLSLMVAGQSFAMAVAPPTHESTQWQELAVSPRDGSGIYWSVNDGKWGHQTEIKVGDRIQFQFSMYKQNVGTHYADFLKAWLDLGQDGYGRGDVIAFEKVVLDPAEYGTYATPSDQDYSFLSAVFNITEQMIGEIFVMARVTCSESLASLLPYEVAWEDQDKISDRTYNRLFAPTGHLFQGEVEEWKINVSATPLPPSVLLFGTGLLGFVAAGRRRFLKV